MTVSRRERMVMRACLFDKRGSTDAGDTTMRPLCGNSQQLSSKRGGPRLVETTAHFIGANQSALRSFNQITGRAAEGVGD